MKAGEIKAQINSLELSEKLLLVEYKQGKLDLLNWKDVHNELREKYK